MLDAWIIDKLRQDEDRQQQPCLELPLPPIITPGEEAEPKAQRGVVIIDLL